MKHLLLLVTGIILYTSIHSQGCTVNYVDPTFQLSATNPGCDPNSGKIEVINPEDGVAPYTYKLVGTSTVNSTGIFTRLPSGTYKVEMHDACGTIRTRQITLIPFQFSFSYTVSPVNGGCHKIQVNFSVSDSSMVYQYGIYSAASNDTLWSNSPVFTVDSVARTAAIVVKDLCGNVYVKYWIAPESVYGYIKELQYRLQCDKVDIFPVYYGFTNPNVCLYDFATKVLIQCKNATGAYTGGPLTNFFNVPYGKPYYVIVQDACNRDSAYFPDMTSSGGSELNPYNWDCTVFSMHVDGMEDTVCLYNATTNTLVSCKGQDTLSINPRTGKPWPSGAVWDSLPYGCYYAWIYDPCTDSTFKIDSCVHYPHNFSASLAGHCSVTQTAVQAWFDPGAKKPFDIKVFYPDGSLATDYPTNNPYSYVLYNTWPQPGTMTVFASDACGHADTSYIIQPLIYPTRQLEVRGGCPGQYGLSGGGDIVLKGNHNAYSTALVTIAKRDGMDTLINKSYSLHNSVTDQYEFYFSNLPTGIYVVESSIGCAGTKFYDTIEIQPYAYPLQLADKIYQCGNNPYLFKDSTTHGVRPFTYEVLATFPLYAPLMTGPQTSNVFNVPQGAGLDSITLKVLDACGNSHAKTFPVQHLPDCTILAMTPANQGSTVINRLIRIYPNPSRNLFTIAISQKKKTNYRVEIVNASGTTLFERLFFNVDKREIMVNERLLPGMYLVKIADLQNGNTLVIKQVIN